jgi:predicted NUDIX family phosphoesterase
MAGVHDPFPTAPSRPRGAGMKDETLVWAVPRERLLGTAASVPIGWQPGEAAPWFDAMREHGAFLPRHRAEDDPEWKQIVPYAAVEHGGRYLLLRRTRRGGDSRLHERWTLAVGGHVEPRDRPREGELGPNADPRADIVGPLSRLGLPDLVARALAREVDEELVCPGRLDPEILGFISDDRDAVGRVHFGIAVLLRSSTPAIEVREKDRLDGGFADLSRAVELGDRLESWSVFLLERLCDRDA